eukprot:g20049.t1
MEYVVHEGWLEQRSHHVGRWKRRYFVLFESGLLKYWRHKPEVEKEEIEDRSAGGQDDGAAGGGVSADHDHSTGGSRRTTTGCRFGPVTGGFNFFGMNLIKGGGNNAGSSSSCGASGSSEVGGSSCGGGSSSASSSASTAASTGAKKKGNFLDGLISTLGIEPRRPKQASQFGRIPEDGVLAAPSTKMTTINSSSGCQISANELPIPLSDFILRPSAEGNSTSSSKKRRHTAFAGDGEDQDEILLERMSESEGGGGGSPHDGLGDEGDHLTRIRDFEGQLSTSNSNEKMSHDLMNLNSRFSLRYSYFLTIVLPNSKYDEELMCGTKEIRNGSSRRNTVHGSLRLEETACAVDHFFDEGERTQAGVLSARMSNRQQRRTEYDDDLFTGNSGSTSVEFRYVFLFSERRLVESGGVQGSSTDGGAPEAAFCMERDFYDLGEVDKARTSCGEGRRGDAGTRRRHSSSAELVAEKSVLMHNELLRGRDTVREPHDRCAFRSAAFAASSSIAPPKAERRCDETAAAHTPSTTASSTPDTATPTSDVASFVKTDNHVVAQKGSNSTEEPLSEPPEDVGAAALLLNKTCDGHQLIERVFFTRPAPEDCSSPSSSLQELIMGATCLADLLGVATAFGEAAVIHFIATKVIRPMVSAQLLSERPMVKNGATSRTLSRQLSFLKLLRRRVLVPFRMWSRDLDRCIARLTETQCQDWRRKLAVLSENCFLRHARDGFPVAYMAREVEEDEQGLEHGCPMSDSCLTQRIVFNSAAGGGDLNHNHGERLVALASSSPEDRELGFEALEGMGHFSQHCTTETECRPYTKHRLPPLPGLTH